MVLNTLVDGSRQRKEKGEEWGIWRMVDSGCGWSQSVKVLVYNVRSALFAEAAWRLEAEG